jgi:hypothetical protein
MNRLLRNIGFFLLLLGASTFFFPLIHKKSMIMSMFGEQEQLAAFIALGVGAVVFALSFRKKKEEKNSPPVG